MSEEKCIDCRCILIGTMVGAGDGTGHSYRCRECALRADLAKMTLERDKWHKETQKWIAEVASLRPVVDAAISLVEVAKDRPYTTWVHPLIDVVNAYQAEDW